MHLIKFEKNTTRDTKSQSFGPLLNGIVVLSENDLKNDVIKLRGYSVSLILIPKTFDLKENKHIEHLLKLSLTPSGQIKTY